MAIKFQYTNSDSTSLTPDNDIILVNTNTNQIYLRGKAYTLPTKIIKGGTSDSWSEAGAVVSSTEIPYLWDKINTHNACYSASNMLEIINNIPKYQIIYVYTNNTTVFQITELLFNAIRSTDINEHTEKNILIYNGSDDIMRVAIPPFAYVYICNNNLGANQQLNIQVPPKTLLEISIIQCVMNGYSSGFYLRYIV